MDTRPGRTGRRDAHRRAFPLHDLRVTRPLADGFAVAALVLLLTAAPWPTRRRHRVPCLDCGTPGHRRRCPACTRTHDRARGTTTQRDYGAGHQAERAAWRPLVEAGEVHCRRCGDPIAPHAPWDLGHPDTACPAPKAPEHRRCNRATAARR